MSVLEPEWRLGTEPSTIVTNASLPPPVLLHKKSLEACGAWAERVGYFVNKGEEVREYDL